jgi:hypothetical protein
MTDPKIVEIVDELLTDHTYAEIATSSTNVAINPVRDTESIGIS